MKTTELLVIVLVVVAGFTAGILFSHKPVSTPPTPSGVDIDRYAGTWYSINEIPQKYSKDCTCTKARYSLDQTNNLLITNTCVINNVTTQAFGEATAVDNTSTRFSVKFINQTLPFAGSYNILAVAPDYHFALVGNDERTALWFLSRTRSLTQEEYSNLLQIGDALGYPIDRVEPVPQTACT